MKITGKGTTEDIAEQVASLDLNLDIPEKPFVDMLADPLPSLAEGEGIQAPVPFMERLVTGMEVASPSYNLYTGMQKKDIDPEIDPNFKMEDNLDLLNGLTPDDYDYMLDSVSKVDAEQRKAKITSEKQDMQRLMKDGAISGMAVTMAAGTILDPIFWGSMLVEGPLGALSVIPKSKRAMNAVLTAKQGAAAMGAFVGGTAALETAVLAKERATVDAEDVLYAGALGMTLGTGTSLLASKALNKGDDFLAAAHAVQDSHASGIVKNLDNRLVNKTVDPVQKEAESIFGKFDPDEIAARRAELQAEDIGIAPTEPIDEAQGYADAMFQNIAELKKTGQFNFKSILESSTFKVLSKNPLMSDFVRLFKTESDSIKYLAMNLLEDASGVTGRQKTAAILKHVTERKFLESTMPDIRSSFKAYAKENGIGITSKEYWSSARTDHFRIMRTELEHYRNAAVRGVEYTSTQPKHIQQAVNSWRKTMKEAAEHARTSGVRGFQDFKVHDGYVPLLWLGKKLAGMPDNVLAKYQELLSRGYQAAGIDAKSAKTIAGAVFNRKLNQARGLDTNPGALLSKDSREFLREMLDLNNVSKAEQDALFGRIDITLAERGKSARAKGRVPIDLTVNDGERSLLDIVDNDLYSVGSRYFTEIAGRSALARKGIRHDGAWRAVKNAALKEAQEKGEQDIAGLGKVLDSTYLQFLGQPVGDGIHKGARRLMEWAMTSMLGTVGAAQLAESANVVAAHGVSNLMKYAPDLAAFRKAVKAGKVDDSILSELNAHIGGLWDEHLFMRPEVRLDQAAGDTGEMWGALDNVLAGSKEFLGYASGMNKIKDIQQQFVAISQANKLIDMVKSGKVMNQKILNRFKDIGWDEGTIQSISEKIKSGIITFQDNGAVNKLNLEQWDAKTYEDFTIGMHRHAAQIIQFPMIGETATWQHSTIGAMLSQFRSFGMLAIEKQTARQIRMADVEAVTAFSYSLGLSALIYMAKTHAMSVGRPDRKEYTEKRLSPGAVFNGALQWSGVFSLASEGVNAASAVGIVPSDWGSDSTGRAGTGAYSFDKNVPALSVLRSGMKFGSGLMTSLSPFNDNQFGNKEIDAAFASIPLGNTYPAILLKNALHNITEED